MMFKKLGVVAVTAVVLCANTAWGQNAQAIRRAKKATALVIVTQGNYIGWGSAFCVSSQGFFITNAHVIPEPGADHLVMQNGNAQRSAPRGPGAVARGGISISRPSPLQVALVLNPSEADQVIYIATVLKIDRGGDLAVLSIPPNAPLAALELGDVDSLVETAPIAAFGYPFGQMLADKGQDFPNITVSTGHITAMRKMHGVLTALQIDAALNPGNSGGPIIDEKGQVVGIVEKGIRGASINFAIPVTKLAKFLEVPLASFTVQRDPKAPTKPAKIAVRVLAIAPDAMKDATVELQLTRDNTPTETFVTKKTAEYVYEASAPIVVAAGQPANGSTGAASRGRAVHEVKFAIDIKRPGKENNHSEGMYTVPLTPAEKAVRGAVTQINP